MKFFTTTGAVLLPFFAAIVGGIEFNPEDEASIRSVTRQYAYSLMSLYQNNATNTPAEDIGIWPQPHYWWEGGAAWGGMIEYSQFTGDDSHVKTLQDALTANYGPSNDFILSYRKGQTGNDDQAFWALAVMSALEYQFPDAADAPAAYLEVAINAFESIVGRWDTTTCNGGLKWQIYPENAYGYNYKNSISNGCAFALGARLARYTGEQKYADWAVKIYDWMREVGLISDIYEVFDGTDDKKNCATVADPTQWTYNIAMFLHGSAFMFDFTKGAEIWKERTSGFLKHAELLFFTPTESSKDIMYEWACETEDTKRECNLDQQSFKAYLSRFLAKTALLAPFTKDTITKYIKASAVGAAKACSGGADGKTCGSKWYTGNWDGTSGVGQQLSALEVTQALLMLKKGTLPAKNGEYQPKPISSVVPKPSPTPSPSPAPTSTKVEAPTSTKVETPTSKAETVPASKSPAPVPVPIASTSSKPTSVQPPISVYPASSSPVPVATAKPDGDVDEVKPTSSVCSKSGTACTCTPTTTTTVYVPATSQRPAPAVPTTSFVLVPVAPPANSSVPTSTPPEEFQGAAASIQATGNLIVGVMVMVLVAGLL